jgi:two-component system OmpR family sensor kinase
MRDSGSGPRSRTSDPVALRDRADGSCRVLTIEGALDQILDNLLANALEVSPPGSTITVTVWRAGGEVLITVRDEGPGMTDHDIERAFDRFFTTGGTGLGLAIVQRLALACGGRAFLRRPAERGLEAGVCLPATR